MSPGQTERRVFVNRRCVDDSVTPTVTPTPAHTHEQR
jgi:hypothetical protein